MNQLTMERYQVSILTRLGMIRGFKRNHNCIMQYILYSKSQISSAGGVQKISGTLWLDYFFWSEVQYCSNTRTNIILLFIINKCSSTKKNYNAIIIIQLINITKTTITRNSITIIISSLVINNIERFHGLLKCHQKTLQFSFFSGYSAHQSNQYRYKLFH